MNEIIIIRAMHALNAVIGAAGFRERLGSGNGCVPAEYATGPIIWRDGELDCSAEPLLGY